MAAQVVETLWYAYGSSAIFTSNPLERRFRNAHAAAQRFRTTPFVEAGQAFLLEDRTPAP